MKETLASLSAKTGYSTTTISRVLNGKGDVYRISQETQRNIKEAADKSHYMPNLVAQNLRKKKTNTIGLILPSISNKYFADIASIIIDEANKYSYTTVVINYMEDEVNERNGIMTLLSQRVDGIIISPYGNVRDILEEINSQHIPIILIDRYFPDTKLSYVTANNFTGGKDATRRLIEKGHKKIACIQGVRSSMPSKKRVEGYTSAMKEAGLEDFIQIVGNDFSINNGYLETKILLEKEEHPTAIFALSNTIVLGVIKAIREAALRIPDDISVISFDNNIYLDYMIPAITRIGQPIEEMAKLATKILFDNIKTGERMHNQIELSPNIIKRDSVADLHKI